MLLVFGVGRVAGATLTTIGTASYLGNDYNLIYEGELGGQGLVWLDYTRGAANWFNQMNWASGLVGNLTVILNAGYTTSIDWNTGWRLPSAGENPQWGDNQTTSEMGHLYSVSLGQPVDGPLGDPSPFEHLQAAVYWSGTHVSTYPNVWVFNFNNGFQSSVYNTLDFQGYALAVHPGEVSPVPERATLLLLASGLVDLAGLRKRFRGLWNGQQTYQEKS
jgi:hypothetical protein